MQTYPYPAQGAVCPLLVAVWPLRYAIGADRGVDAGALGLPALTGTFPTLESGVPSGRPMQYSQRLLRDGWLYLWLENQGRLAEYGVNNASLAETDRGGPVIDGRNLPYFIIPAGEGGKLVWSPVRWTDTQFDTAKSRADVRNRIMRSVTLGGAPNSDFITRQPANLLIGDYSSPDGYGWSTAPDTGSRPDMVRTIFAMNHCEQQAWAIVDDPWGIVQDLAALTRLRHQAHDVYLKDNAEDWATAGVLRSLAKSDDQLGQKMNRIADTRRLNEVWQAMDTAEDGYAEEIASLTGYWADWFITVHGQGPSSLDTACGHFDITIAEHRDALEDHFAAACLGPSDKPEGIVAVRKIMTLPPEPQKPWLLWSLLGLRERLDAGSLASILGVAENIADATPEMAQEATRLTQALTLSAAINLSAIKIKELGPTAPRQHMFAAMAPAAALSMRSWPQEADSPSKIFMAAALARSGQQLEVVPASQKEIGMWLGEITGSKAPTTAKLPSTGDAAIPHFTLKASSTAVTPPNPLSPASPQASTPLPGPAANSVQSMPRSPQLLNLSTRAIQDAPVRSAIAVLAAVNLIISTDHLLEERKIGTLSQFVGAGFSFIAGMAAVVEKLSNVDWKQQVQISGVLGGATKRQLANALTAAAWSQSFSGIVSAANIVFFGTEAVDAYRHGDLNTAGLDVGLMVASAGQLALQVKAYRTYRLARAAVMLGQVTAIRTGTAVLGGPLTFALTSVAALIVSGVIVRQYTQNTPLERWVANTRYGVKPEPWSGSHRGEMEKLYALLYPVTLNLQRYPELNPRTGAHIEVTWLILRLEGQKGIRDGMLRFEGKEIWSGTGWFDRSLEPITVNWTESDFEVDGGTRRPQEAGVTRYRRVYHQEPDKGRLVEVEGTLFYSPIEGFELPSVEIKDSAWI
ncbi:toxin VasX [Pseudomonas saliphila]|uniref:toxin VasX n=1 Tax=Pseudomonas saliphila TaxID=2586906 RepID=UPI002E2582A7